MRRAMTTRLGENLFHALFGTREVTRFSHLNHGIAITASHKK
jgi:hypothetical protein